MITSSFIKTTLDKKREKRRKKKKKEKKSMILRNGLFQLPFRPFLWISPGSHGRIITRSLFVVFRLFRLPKKTCRGVICLPNLLSYQKRQKAESGKQALGGWACASAYSPKQSKTPFLLRSVAASLLPSWQKEPFLPARGSSLGTSPAPQFHGPIGPYTCIITSFNPRTVVRN